MCYCPIRSLPRSSTTYATTGTDLDTGFDLISPWPGRSETLPPGDQSYAAPLCGALDNAHGRRNFFKLAELAKAPVAIEAVQRIDAIFDIERTINGRPIEQRRAVRQRQFGALVDDLQGWLRGVSSRCCVMPTWRRQSVGV
jgi:transposase